MTFDNCASLPRVTSDASFYGPRLQDVCNATTLLTFMSILQSQVEKIDVITGASKRVKPIEIPDDEYDFIVVGSGAGGSVVASRLSENPEWKVLLLEAGPDEPAASGIPAISHFFLEQESIAWLYSTSDEPMACTSTNGSCPFHTGKTLGGNTAHNALIWLRGNPTDYNNWAALGNEGWTWDEVKDFFKKVENNGEIERVGTEHHGTDGPLGIERFSYAEPFGLALLDASEEVGYGVSEDLNGDQLTGFSWIQATSKNGVRSSAASSYLRPARNRKNLHISLDSHVTRVLIENQKAVGVEYYKNGEYKKVYATKEVVVSGGALNSPQILLLSGIGPKEHLESVGVPVILDLPGVGENLQDHASSKMHYALEESDAYINNWAAAIEYLLYQTGPLAAWGTTSIVGMLATDMTEPDFPDLQIYVAGYIPGCAQGEIGALQSDGKRQVTLLASYDHPKSRGTITLASNDPFEYPIIRANLLTHPNDMEAHIKGMRMVTKLTKAEALKQYNMTMLPVEGCTEYEEESDELYTCIARYDNYAMYHLAGSCKMGPASDPMAVVDPRLRVHGIEGLRVVDASIMPLVTSSNTQAPTYMIGERGADFIKEDWSDESASPKSEREDIIAMKNRHSISHRSLRY